MIPNEKGKTLEQLAILLFEGLDYLSVREKRCRTSTSEIDLVLEHNISILGNPFTEFGRYSLVECKNWAVPATVSVVRDFGGKLEDTKTKLGFLLSRNGVTGDEGTDALKLIRDKWLYADLWGKVSHRRIPREPVDGSYQSFYNRRRG